MPRLKDNINLKELEKFGFEKLYRYKGSIHSGLIKIFNGYNYCYYNKEENTKNDILVVYKKDRIIKCTVDENDPDLLHIANDIISNLQKNNLLEKEVR